jgi:hypothetical protein
MRSPQLPSMLVAAALAAGPVLLSAQSSTTTLLPDFPKKAFGASISPAYDGWYTNSNGTHTFLIGYYSRNWSAALDIPVGPDNHFEPGNPDRGQPTHFLPNRNFGMFTVTVSANTPPTEKFWWVLTVNGVTQRVPFHRSPDYNITPTQASEEGPSGKYNLPPILRFAPSGPPSQSPVASVATALKRAAVAGVPMALDLFVEDDAEHASGSNAPMGARVPPLVELVIAKYRGPGRVVVGNGHEKLTTIKGGKLMEPYAGRASTTVTFDQPGDYLVHVTANDLSGKGGGATGCCWTTALVSVSVSAPRVLTPTGQ